MYDSLDRLIIKYVKTNGTIVQSLMNTYDDKGRVSDFDYSIAELGSRKSYSTFYSNGSLSCFRPANPGSPESADWIGFTYDKFDRTVSRIIGREDGSIPSHVYTYTYKDLSTTQTTNLVASLGCSISGTTQLCKCICIDVSSILRIIISALEVVESCLGVVVITSVADRVD